MDGRKFYDRVTQHPKLAWLGVREAKPPDQDLAPPSATPGQSIEGRAGSPRSGRTVVTLAALCDVDPDAAGASSAEYGVPGYTELDEMLEKEKLDGITICAPHWFHPPIAIAAFEAGVNVLTEKPVAVTVEDAEKMIAAAREAKKTLGVVFQHRTDPLNAKAREVVASGSLGELHRLALTAAWFRPEVYYTSGAWRGTWKGEGGGVLLNQAPHSLDLFQWISGMMPDRVYGRADAFLHEIEVEDRASALLHYPNGATGYIYASTIEYPSFRRMEFAGDRGKLVLDGSGMRLSLFDRPLREFSLTTDDETGEPGLQLRDVPAEPDEEGGVGGFRPLKGHRDVIADFAKAIRGHREPMVTGIEGLKSLELANAIILSSHRGEAVGVPIPRKSYSELMRLLAGRKPPRRRRRVRASGGPSPRRSGYGRAGGKR